jgi:hypothetical protein
MIIGDVVYLNSNPDVLMTVSYILGQYPKNDQEKQLDTKMRQSGYSDRDVCCTWFCDKKLETGYFKEKMVTKK